MELTLALAAGAALVVAGAAVLGPRLRIPSPLLLVAVGIAVSVVLAVAGAKPFEADPEVVLLGVLPPLLYASSVSLPTMDLRREFGAVSGLSVLLVLLTALVLGWVLTLVVPGLAYPWAVALAAVISPTDAVATSIVKRTNVSHRVTAILEGESLLNDATALVLLTSAITAGTQAGALSAPEVVLGFVRSVVVAVIVGFAVGRLSLTVRSRIGHADVGTLLSFAVPFVAAVPAELLGGSGLVAAVLAGLTVGRQGPRLLSPQQRASDELNWRTVSLALEGAVFLLMGLEIQSIVEKARAGQGGLDVLAQSVGLGALAVAVALVLRAAFVVPLLRLLQLRARRGAAFRTQLETWQEQIKTGDPDVRTPLGHGRRKPMTQRQRDQFAQRVRQGLADVDYLAARPLGAKEGAVVVWAGMRGAVTVAAAQTIPLAEEHGPALRNLLVLIAFAAAAISLLVQGGTLTLLIRLLKPAGDDPEQIQEERDGIIQLLRDTSDGLPAQQDDESPAAFRLRHLQAQRVALLDARDEGIFDSVVLSQALATVDASEIAMQARGDLAG